MKGQRDLGSRVRQEGIIEEHGVFTSIQCHARLSGMRYITNNAYLANFQPMSIIQHFSSAAAIGSAQNGIFSSCIQQEYTYMIITKLLADYFRHLHQ